jgi:hypothetical protein
MIAPRPCRLPVVPSVALLAAVVAFFCAALAIAPVLAEAAGPPVASTGVSSEATPTSVKLAGTVNPNGLPTTVAFDYGTSTAYGSSTATQDAGTGTTAVDVTATVTGLKAATTYHYRLSAANTAGTDAGVDRTFTTPATPVKPTIASQPASAIGTESATIGAAINPQGQPTSVVFDYGPTTAYGSTTAPQDVGTGTTAVTLKATIGGLEPGTTYHFRARATNATGTTNGSDRSFKTTSARKAAVSTGGVADLKATSVTVTGSVDPNGRATQVYVQVGPTTKYGAQTPAVGVGAGDTAVPVTIGVAGLTPLRTYHYRLVAISDAGTVTGADKTFTTPRVANTLTLSARPNPVVYGHPAIIGVTLTGTGAGAAPLSLFASPFPFGGPFAAFSPGTATDGAGRASTVVTPRVTTRYQATAVAAGQTVAGRTLRLSVAPSVTIRAARRSGGKVRFTGVIRPRGNATVSLRRVLANGTAVTVKRVRATRVPGAFFARYSITVTRRSARYLVHVKPDSRGLVAGDSAKVRVRVRR